jgi:transcriptional regulator with XRE-family HTH domain
MKKINTKIFPEKATISSLGEKIEAARRSKKLSQEKLAELLGVSRASVSLYETNSGRPSYKVLGKLSEVLGVSFMELAGSDYMDGDNPSTMFAQQMLSNSNNDRSNLIHEYLGRDEAYLEIEFIGKPTDSYGLVSDNSKVNQNVVEDNHIIVGKKDMRWPSISVLAIDGVDYSNARVFIVEDNKLGPRYPKGSRHVLHPILNKNSWQYLTGVHGISINSESTIIRRIIVNNYNNIVLADCFGNEMVALVKDIEMIWKVGQATHMPPED